MSSNLIARSSFSSEKAGQCPAFCFFDDRFRLADGQGARLAANLVGNLDCKRVDARNDIAKGAVNQPVTFDPA